MDVPPLGQPNGHTVVLLHGNNFAGPIMPYSFTDMARNTRLILQSLKIDKAMVVGHSMGGMLAARFELTDPTPPPKTPHPRIAANRGTQ